ncbi:MAG TPA: hypothetical protein DCZ34_01010 [Clostridiales bacterium]|nr:hypothetical protein [Clostridiales bacterium]
MKKIKAFMLVSAIMLSATGLCLIFSSSAQSGSAKVIADSNTFNINDWQWTQSSNPDAEMGGKYQLILNSYKGNATNVSIPGLYTGELKSGDGQRDYYVCVGRGCFKDKSTIVEITFGSDGNKVYTTDSTQYLFGYCSKLGKVDLSKLDTRNVTDMSCMFSGCSSLTSLDVSSFDTSKVTDMSYMFKGYSKLTKIDVSNFYTLNVTKFDGIFDGCNSLRYLDLSSFEIKKGAQGAYYMITGLQLEKIVTPKSVDSSQQILLTYFNSGRNGSFADENGQRYQYLPTSSKTLYFKGYKCFQFSLSNKSDENDVFVLTPKKDEWNEVSYELYKNDAYEIKTTSDSENTYAILIKYTGTGTNVTIPSKILIHADNQYAVFTTKIELSGSENFFGEQSKNIKTIKFGSEFDNDSGETTKVKCAGIENFLKGLTNVDLLDLSGCEFVASGSSETGETGEFSELSYDEKKKELVRYGIMTQEQFDEFMSLNDYSEKVSYLKNRYWEYAKKEDASVTEEQVEELWASDSGEMMLTMFCGKEPIEVNFKIKKIIMPNISGSDAYKPEINLNNEYTYTENGTTKVTSKLLFDGQTVTLKNDVETGGSEVANTGVELSFVLPVLLCVATVVAFATINVLKKRKQF